MCEVWMWRITKCMQDKLDMGWHLFGEERNKQTKAWNMEYGQEGQKEYTNTKATAMLFA